MFLSNTRAEEEKRADFALANADVTLKLDTRLEIKDWSFDKNFQHSLPVTRGDSFLELFPLSQRTALETAFSKVQSSGQYQWIKMNFLGDDADFFWRFQKVEKEGSNSYFVASGHWLTKSLLASTKPKYLIDVLTNLPDKYAFHERLNTIIASNKSFNIIVGKVHILTKVNDQYGEQTGDALLQYCAGFLKNFFEDKKEKDPCVFYLGGSKFGVISFDSEVTPKLEAFFTEFKKPHLLNTQLLKPDMKMGAIAVPNFKKESKVLVSLAEKAIKKIIDEKDSFYFYNLSLEDAAANSAIIMKQKIKQGIVQGEFFLEYQPILNSNESLLGVEALMRWKSAQGEIIPPLEFIPSVEKTGFMGVLGNWAMKHACAELVKFSKNHLVSVNVSPVQFLNPRFIDLVKDALLMSGLSASNLQLEITEGILMRDPELAIKILNDLSAMGVQLALDDFGTGYSSLSYLKKFKLDVLKIDQSFIRDVEHCNKDKAICESVIGLSKQLGLKCVAEGIETKAQYTILKNMGCDEFQGFYFARPSSLVTVAEKYIK